MTDKKWGKVTKAMPGVRDGEVYPEDFKVGDIVLGDLAVRAIKHGWAEEGEGEPPIEPKKPGTEKLPENLEQRLKDLEQKVNILTGLNEQRRDERNIMRGVSMALGADAGDLDKLIENPNDEGLFAKAIAVDKSPVSAKTASANTAPKTTKK